MHIFFTCVHYNTDAEKMPIFFCNEIFYTRQALAGERGSQKYCRWML